MSKYNVTLLISATTNVEVEANSRQEAIDKAMESDHYSPRLCWQCGSKVEVGEAYDYIVYDENGNEAKP